MKNIVLLSFLLMSGTVFSQMVPEEWEADLAARHPKASAVNWIPGDEIYTAEFQEGDRWVKAIYSQQGEWKMSIMEIPVSEVPSEIIESVATGYEVTGASKEVSVKSRDAKYILELKAVYTKKGELVMTDD